MTAAENGSVITAHRTGIPPLHTPRRRAHTALADVPDMVEDVVTAVTTLDGDPTIDSLNAAVPVIISQTVQHTSGEITPYTTYTATADLERTDDGWKVANYRLDNASR